MPKRGLGICAAESVEAKWAKKESSLVPLLRTVAEATVAVTGTKWDFSPSITVDALLPRKLLSDRWFRINRPGCRQAGNFILTCLLSRPHLCVGAPCDQQLRMGSSFDNAPVLKD